MNQPEKNKEGFWIFRQLPDGSTPMTMNHFTNRANLLPHNTPFVVLGLNSKVYEFYRICRSASEALPEFIKAGRIWIIPHASRPADTDDYIYPEEEDEISTPDPSNEKPWLNTITPDGVQERMKI
jgi:hypothetical protein